MQQKRTGDVTGVGQKACFVKELVGVLDGLAGTVDEGSRAVATPFVGALAAVLALAEVMRPLHGGLVYAALDVQMRTLRHRTGAAPSTYQGLQTAFVQAKKRPVSSTREAA